MFKVICVDHVGIACKDLDVSEKILHRSSRSGMHW